jgi:hypothetical protein
MRDRRTRGLKDHGGQSQGANHRDVRGLVESSSPIVLRSSYA